MRIDDEETPGIRTRAASGDFADQGDERPRAERERARPAVQIAEQATIEQQRQHGHVGLRADGGTQEFFRQ